MIHLPSGLRGSLQLTKDLSPEAYNVARQALSTSRLGDEVGEHHELFNNTFRRVLKTSQTE
eukprot:9682225-Prorocentrum_lima.AAC.1